MSRSGVTVDLHLILRAGGKVLMGLRKNTGFCDGMYHLPAGHLEDGETILQGTAREAKEELDIDTAEGDLTLVHVMHHCSGRLALFFEAEKWSGTVANAEPDKCEALDWLSPASLPENVIPYTAAALESVRRRDLVSTFGWS